MKKLLVRLVLGVVVLVIVLGVVGSGQSHLNPAGQDLQQVIVIPTAA